MKKYFEILEHTPMGDRKTKLNISIEKNVIDGLVELDVGPDERVRFPLSEGFIDGTRVSFLVVSEDLPRRYLAEIGGEYIKGEVIFEGMSELSGIRTPFDGRLLKEVKFDFQAAVCGDSSGVIMENSTLDAIVGAEIFEEEVRIPPSPISPEGGSYTKTTINGGTVTSEKGNFNGAIFRGGEWIVTDTKIQVKGAIGNDFVGLGAGILVEGDASAILDGVEIHCEDAARTAIVAREKGKILVKNATLTVQDGDLEPDYVGTVFPEKMKSAPWMLGIDGNTRATNLMGNASATYFNSVIQAEKWGVLSTDDNVSVSLWAVNCDVEITGGKKTTEIIYENAANGKFDFYNDQLEHMFPEGEWQSTNKPSGYGTYSIGATNVVIAGSKLVVPDYIAICANGPSSLRLTSSDVSSIANANKYLDIANDIETKSTVAISNRFGVMYHSGAGFGVTTVEKGTVMYTGKTAFQVKGCGTIINVDHSYIYPGDGIILQVMDNDDAGINVANFETTTDYIERHINATATEISTRAGTLVREGGVFSTFSNTTLIGDIYNASGWEGFKETVSLAGAGEYANEVGGGSSASTDLSVVLDNVIYTGLISTTEAYHKKSVIGHADYDLIGEVTNTVCIPENAAVVVRLKNNTIWNVTGTGYVTSLTIDETSSIGNAKVYVNGKEIEVKTGTTYTGVVKIVGNATRSKSSYINPCNVRSGCSNYASSSKIRTW